MPFSMTKSDWSDADAVISGGEAHHLILADDPRQGGVRVVVDRHAAEILRNHGA
jgi:hypothetical protein